MSQGLKIFQKVSLYNIASEVAIFGAKVQVFKKVRRTMISVKNSIETFSVIFLEFGRAFLDLKMSH